MAHEMFGDVAAPRPSRTRFRRVLTAASIALHAIVISAIVVVQVFAVGALPVPHRPLIFDELRLPQLVDVPPPPPPPRPGPSNPSQAPANLAPVVEPQAITPETERQHERTTEAPGAVPGVGDGSGLDLLSVCKGCVTTPPP